MFFVLVASSAAMVFSLLCGFLPLGISPQRFFFHVDAWAPLCVVGAMCLVVVGCFKLASVYECVCVCVFAGMHNNTKPIQCHEGKGNLRGKWGGAVSNAWEGAGQHFYTQMHAQ